MNILENLENLFSNYGITLYPPNDGYWSIRADTSNCKTLRKQTNIFGVTEIELCKAKNFKEIWDFFLFVKSIDEESEPEEVKELRLQYLTMKKLKSN